MDDRALFLLSVAFLILGWKLRTLWAFPVAAVIMKFSEFEHFYFLKPFSSPNISDFSLSEDRWLWWTVCSLLGWARSRFPMAERSRPGVSAIFCSLALWFLGVICVSAYQKWEVLASVLFVVAVVLVHHSLGKVKWFVSTGGAILVLLSWTMGTDLGWSVLRGLIAVVWGVALVGAVVFLVWKDRVEATAPPSAESLA